MNTNVDVDAMRKDAVEIFQKGFACSESVIYAIKKGFDLEMSDDAIAMSSGFPWGLEMAAVFAAHLLAERCVLAISLEEERREMMHF